MSQNVHLLIKLSNQMLSLPHYYMNSNREEVKVAQLCPDSLQPHGLYISWNSPGQSTGVGSLSLLQGIFPIQGSNPDLPYCRRILYQLSQKRSPQTGKAIRVKKKKMYVYKSHSKLTIITSLLQQES